MLNRDYAEMLSALSELGCEFVVVGAYALAAHGIPRATGDIDILIAPSAANASRVHAALTRFGAPVAALDPADLIVPGSIFQIGVAPCRIDILNQIDGVSYEQVAANAITLSVDGLDVPFIGRAELIANKLASGRAKDLVDVDMLRDLGSGHG